MSYSIHIVRRTADGQETPITLDEWNAYIELDSEMMRPEPGHPHFNERTALLSTDTVRPEDCQSIRWVSGSLLSDYPMEPLLKKMGQIARHLGAVIMSDDGDIWRIDESGKVTIEEL